MGVLGRLEAGLGGRGPPSGFVPGAPAPWRRRGARGVLGAPLGPPAGQPLAFTGRPGPTRTSDGRRPRRALFRSEGLSCAGAGTYTRWLWPFLAALGLQGAGAAVSGNFFWGWALCSTLKGVGEGKPSAWKTVTPAWRVQCFPAVWPGDRPSVTGGSVLGSEGEKKRSVSLKLMEFPSSSPDASGGFAGKQRELVQGLLSLCPERPFFPLLGSFFRDVRHLLTLKDASSKGFAVY